MKQRHSSYQWVLWMFAWGLASSLAMAIAKLVHGKVSTPVIVFSRVGFGLFFFLPLILRHKRELRRPKKLFLNILSGVCVSFSILCTYYAYTHLPLALATSIGFSGPFFTITLAIILLRERLSAIKWLLVVTGYIGVLVMVQPSTYTFSFAVLVALIANLCAGGVRIVIRYLSNTASSEQILIFNNLTAFIVFGLNVIFYWQTPTLTDTALLATLGLLGIFSQHCYIQALKLKEASFIAPFEYIRLIFAIPLGFLLFQEIPKIGLYFGSVIIIVSNLLLLWIDVHKKKAASPD